MIHPPGVRKAGALAAEAHSAPSLAAAAAAPGPLVCCCTDSLQPFLAQRVREGKRVHLEVTHETNSFVRECETLKIFGQTNDS